MQNSSYPFAMRLIGFSNPEAALIESIITRERGRWHGYVCLQEDSLQDPDLYLVNADEPKALAALSYLSPSEARPALLVGSFATDLPHERLQRPIQPTHLLEALDFLIEKRAAALSQLEASEVVTVTERRRRDRIDLDLTDPSEYWRMRRRTPTDGGVLIVDKNPVFRDYVAELLARRNVPVEWVDDETKANDLCEQKKIAVVMINTSTPGIDPYRLCEAIKNRDAVENAAIIFLISKPFVYDQIAARRVGCEGFLNKPLTNKHLVSVLKKFLPLAN